MRPAKRDRRKGGSTTHHRRGIHRRSNELSRTTWRNDRDYRCSRDQRRHGEETGYRWMIATSCGSFLTVPFVLAKEGRFAFAGAPESGHITLNTDKTGTCSLRSRPGACPARHRRSRQHLPVASRGPKLKLLCQLSNCPMPAGACQWVQWVHWPGQCVQCAVQCAAPACANCPMTPLRGIRAADL